MTEENKDLEPTEENTSPDANLEAGNADAPFNPAFPAEEAAPEILTQDSDASPVDLAAPSQPVGDVGEEGVEAPAADPTAGAVDAPAEDATTEAPATSTSPATGEGSSAEPAAPGEPADMAGAPSAGKPIDAAVPVVPTDAGYPVPKEDENEAPIHPVTLEPLKGDGLGDDLGKTADDAATESSPSTGSTAAAPAAEVDHEAEGNNVAELEAAVASLTGRFDGIDGKLEGLEKQLKKILHKL